MSLRPIVALLTVALSGTFAHASAPQKANLSQSLAQSTARFRLASPGVHPWHLKATVQLLSNNGKTSESGTVEEFFASEQQKRIIYSFPSFHQTATFTYVGEFREGDQSDPPMAMRILMSRLAAPAEAQALASNAKLKMIHMKTDGERLNCVQAAWPKAIDTPSDLRMQTLCTAPGSPALRSVTTPTVDGGAQEAFTLLFDDIQSFQGGDVPTNSTVLIYSKPVLRMHITSIAPLTDAEEDADLQPSEKALPYKLSLMTRPRSRSAIYSAQLMRMVMQGAEVNFGALVKFTIGTDGIAKDVVIESTTNDPVAHALVNNIQTARFVPATRNGQPFAVSMETTVNLGRGAEALVDDPFAEDAPE